jgi:hypothetical protein
LWRSGGGPIGTLAYGGVENRLADCMFVAFVALVWVAIGIATGLFEARRGHWARTWVLGAILGPF